MQQIQESKNNDVDSFESKLMQANEILSLLNDPSTSLEQSVALHKKGQTLLKEASKILENAKLSIEQVLEEDL